MLYYIILYSNAPRIPPRPYWMLGGLEARWLELLCFRSLERRSKLQAKMMLQRLRRGLLARLLRGIWWSVGALGGLLAASWEPLGASLGPLGGLLGALGGLLGRLGSLVGCQEGPEGAILAILGGSWGLLERSWGLLEASWEPLGRLLGAFWRHLMAVWG